MHAGKQNTLIKRNRIMEKLELLKLISLLMQYPDEEIYSLEWKSDLKDIEIPELYENLIMFEEYLHNNSLNKLQENYVQTFDFNDKTNLYLTYSKLGDEKERGQVLVELKEIYKFAGFELESYELPDYLPLLLEFVSHADGKIRRDLLSRFRNPIEQIQLMLAEQNSPYATLLKGLLIFIDRFILKEVLL